MRIALGLIGAACLAVANGFSVAQREKFLESAVRIRSHAIQHAEAVAGRALQGGVTDQELKDAFIDAYDEYFASCLGAYGMDQYVRCTAEVSLDLVFSTIAFVVRFGNLYLYECAQRGCTRFTS